MKSKIVKTFTLLIFASLLIWFVLFKQNRSNSGKTIEKVNYTAKDSLKRDSIVNSLRAINMIEKLYNSYEGKYKSYLDSTFILHKSSMTKDLYKKITTHLDSVDLKRNPEEYYKFGDSYYKITDQTIRAFSSKSLYVPLTADEIYEEFLLNDSKALAPWFRENDSIAN